MKAFDTISGAPQPSPLSGLELLSYAVILVDAELAIRHANPAAENLFAISRRNLQGMPLVRLLGRLPELEPALRTALDNNWSYSAHNLECTTGDNVVHHIDCTVSPINVGSARLLRGLFNRGPIPVGGDNSTILQTRYTTRFPMGLVRVLPSYRQIIEVGSWDRMQSITATGQSGHPFSPNYDDQMVMWREGAYHLMPWSRAAVEKAAVNKLILKPGKSAA